MPDAKPNQLTGQDSVSIGMKVKTFNDADLTLMAAAYQLWLNTVVVGKSIHVLRETMAFNGGECILLVTYYELQTDLIPPVTARYAFGYHTHYTPPSA